MANLQQYKFNPLKKVEVWQGNEITLGRFKFTKMQARIYYNMLKQISLNYNENKRMQLELNFGNYPVAIKYKDLIDLNQRNLHHMSELKHELTAMGDKVIRLRNGGLEVRLICAIHYDQFSDKVVLEIHNDVKNALVEVYENYKNTTRYFFDAAVKMQGVYSDRLYQIFSKTKDLKVTEYDLTELKEMLCCNNNTYKSFSRFRDLILEPSIDEINELSDLYVTWAIGLKEGKGIKTITVNIENNTEEMKEADLNKFEKYYNLLITDYGLSPWQANNIIQSCPLNEITLALYELQTYVKVNKQVKKSVGGYSVKYLSNKLNIDLSKPFNKKAS